MNCHSGTKTVSQGDRLFFHQFSWGLDSWDGQVRYLKNISEIAENYPDF